MCQIFKSTVILDLGKVEFIQKGKIAFILNSLFFFLIKKLKF